MRTPILGAALAVLAARATSAAPTVINFENLPPGTTVTNQYSPQGVSFPRRLRAGRLRRPLRHPNPPFPQSRRPGADPGPLRIDFATGQRYVKVYAGTMVGNTRGTLKAFSASGQLLAQDGKKPVSTGAFAVVFQVRVPSATIRRVELLYESGVIVDIAEEEACPSQPTRNPSRASTISSSTSARRLRRRPWC